MCDYINYYKNRKGELYKKYTKSEIKDLINPFQPSTFIPILKDMDYPYFEYIWGQTLAKTAEHSEIKTTIGKYIAKMNLHDFKLYNFEDSKYHNDLDQFHLQPYGIHLKNNIYKYSINQLKGY